MQKRLLKRYLDYVPFFILSVAAVSLLIKASQYNIILKWQHYTGFVLLAVIAALLLQKKHKLAMLVLGLTLIAGYAGYINYSPVLRTFTFSVTTGSVRIPLCNGQPAIILCLFLHFIFSGRYYYGILTNKYWITLLNDN